MASKKPSKYVGDASVTKCLERYNSQTPFHVVRMRVFGALSSPNKDLLPVMVVASFWPEDAFPKFITKDEAEAFFATFMGLWRRMEKMTQASQSVLSAVGKLQTLEDVKALLQRRVEEVEAGFIEGFWGGKEDLNMASATAALIDGLSGEAEAYHTLLEDIAGWTEYGQNMRDAIADEITERDTICEDAMRGLRLLKEKMSEDMH